MINRILLLLVFMPFAIHGQSTHQPNPGKAFVFIDSLLKKESYTIEFLDFPYPKELQEIRNRFLQSCREKNEWYQEYASKYYKEGKGLPYHENFGITKDEYVRITDLENTMPEVVVRGSAPLKAVRSSTTFSFKVADSDLQFLETLKIDFGNKVLTFLNDTIPLKSEIKAPVKPLGEWHGYSWLKETPTLKDDEENKIDSITALIIVVDFGKRTKDNKTILRLRYKRIDKVEVKADMDLSCYLN